MGLFPRVADGPSLPVGLRCPSHACYSSLAGAATPYSSLPECQCLSDERAWFHHSELERHFLALSNLCEGIFLDAYVETLGKEIQADSPLLAKQQGGSGC